MAQSASANDVYPTCDLKWLTHSTGNGFGDVVDVQFDDEFGSEFGSVENGTVDACAQAITAAKTVATKVARAS